MGRVQSGVGQVSAPTPDRPAAPPQTCVCPLLLLALLASTRLGRCAASDSNFFRSAHFSSCLSPCAPGLVLARRDPGPPETAAAPEHALVRLRGRTTDRQLPAGNRCPGPSRSPT